MVTNKKVILTEDEYWDIDNTVCKGYYVHEYIRPPKTVETDICCPKCNEKLFYDQVGISYQITCPTEDCVDIVARGI